MAKLSLKTVKRKKLAHGQYCYMISLKRESYSIQFTDSNAGMVENMRSILRTTCLGRYRLDWSLNWMKKRVYTHLYLTNAMDLAMLKLVHADKIHKIYKIDIKQSS